VPRFVPHVVLFVSLLPHVAFAQDQEAPPPVDIHITVVGTTPLPGVEMPLEQVPAPVQTSTAADIDRSGALDLSDFVNRRMAGVHLNEIQGNPFQADVNYRGYTASPLLGTPQGLSVYLDGVRLNQPFGDVVSWDLIPRVAIASTTLMPGSNPLFGLNTLGGALALQTKSGRSHPGTTVQATYGSDVRRALDVEHGGGRATGWNWYVAASLFAEDGWRDASPTDVRQLFGTLGWERDANAVSLSVSHARNALTGNALQEIRLLDADYESVYTVPDDTDHRATFVNLALRRRAGTGVAWSANLYYRDIDTRTLNGDVNEESLDQSLYQPSAVERAGLIAAGYDGVPAAGATAANTPFPSWRCIANVLLRDEPAEKCNGLVNRSHTTQHHVGASGQMMRFDAPGGWRSQFTAGAAFDRARAGYIQSSQLGFINPDRGITGLDAFADGETGGTIDGEPFDTRVDLDGTITTGSVFGSETLSRGRVHVTLSGRFNRTSVDNRDGITPGGGSGSLDGAHAFSRLNPAAGLTFNATPSLNLYAGYTEGSRAPTSIELGCADPESPCRLPNSMAGDPPLSQVVTRALDAGVRAQRGPLSWNAGVFVASNHNDILFVQSDQTGFGYFRNVARTRRAGFDLGVAANAGRARMGAAYTRLAATFGSDEVVNGQGNSSNDQARAGAKGFEGSIDIEAGDRMPLVPRHLLKVYADVPLTAAVSLDLDLIAASGVLARGNENDRHAPDGVYYLGPGATDAYAVVTLGARYAVRPWLQVLGQISNLFDRRYTTAAQLGPTALTPAGTFVARALPAVGGEFPVPQSTFLAPGAPIRAWAGLRVHF
jgi:outer membrane receptor protein involved in Fe transport